MFWQIFLFPRFRSGQLCPRQLPSATSENPLSLQNQRGENLHDVTQLFSASQKNKRDEKLNTDIPDKVGSFVAWELSFEIETLSLRIGEYACNVIVT